MAPVSTIANPSRAATRREAVDLPAPAGPSIATMKGRGMPLLPEHLPERREALLVLGAEPDRDPLRRREAAAAHRADDHALAEERLEELLPRLPREVGEDEVPLRGDHRRAERGEARGEERPPLADERAAPLDVLRVVERGDAGGLGDQVDVERRPHPVDVLDDLRPRDPVPEPEAGEAVDLRERPE